MNGIHQNGKNRNFEKTHSGCLGGMVNLVELNIGVSPNKLLTDKPHRDGSALSRSRSDVSRMSPSRDPIEDKLIVSKINNTPNRKSNGTPMKTLIAQEMSKEVNPRLDSPNLVAKLMGLDALPCHEPDSTMQRSISRCHPRSHSDIPMTQWEQLNGLFHYIEPKEYKDAYEIWQQSQSLAHKERYEETTINKKMALVRQKFVEAKRLSMDENLRQSRQFQDALEVLSSNRDLFVKCLQEPKPIFSQNLHNSIPPPETKRITVLRPSMMADSNNFSLAGNKDGKQVKKSVLIQLNELEKSHKKSSPPASWNSHTEPTQPTRIVVLKPSFVKPHSANTVCSPQSQSPRILHHEDYMGDIEDEESQESRKVAKSLTQRMHKKNGRHCRDETLASSVLFNGYAGDDSSFNRSEIEFADGNLSDSGIMSPVSRHSWDCVNGLGSPYSSSSFSRASYSPESSVCREAKKRLSERWAIMASNGSYQEQRHVRRGSSTLGEMLALSEAKKAPAEEGISSAELKKSDSILVAKQRKAENDDNSPRNLTRSKSVPVSFTEFGTRINVDVSVLDKGKVEATKEDTKTRSVKSSLKGKVSSLFFSRNKKTCKEKSLATETKDGFDSFPGEISNNGTKSVSGKGSVRTSPGLQEPSCKASFSNLIGKQEMVSSETGLTEAKPIASGNPGETQDQLSPISVFDPLFEEDEHTSEEFPHHLNPNQRGVDPPLNSIRSNLIDKSPTIGSIARTLSWDDSCIHTASSNPSKEPLTTQGTDEEHEWFFLVKTLLSVAGLQDEVQSNSSLARWHSPESPLDPSLRDNYIDFKETVHEAKRRQKRSTRKLVFDCVNEALVDITGYRLGSGQRSGQCIGGYNTLVDELWARMNEWFSQEVKCVSGESGDDENDLVVERVVRKEVVGKGWNGHFRFDMDDLENEIERMLLEELLQEVVVELELTGRL